MIQRIQSIWLLLAALCCLGLFFFDIYHADLAVNGVNTIKAIKVNDHYPSLLIALVITLMPLAAIFMFKNRKRQRLISVFSIVASIGFITMALGRVTNFNNDNPAAVNGTYWIGAVLPVAAIIFLAMALGGIRKDEKLVRSVDRLR